MQSHRPLLISLHHLTFNNITLPTFFPLYSPLAVLALNILFMDLPRAPGWGGCFSC